MASDTAERLIGRGFGELLGVNVRTWEGKQPSFESLNVNGNTCSVQQDYKELIPLNDEVYADSTVIHKIEGKPTEYLFPGTTVYNNKNGGLSIVFSGTPKTGYNIVEAFSFLNYSRKQQLINMMKLAGELPVYFPGDEEVYLKAADMPDGSLFCSIFNISFDVIENIEIVCDREVETIERMTPEGQFETIGFKKKENLLKLDIPANILEPVILRIKYRRI